MKLNKILFLFLLFFAFTLNFLKNETRAEDINTQTTETNATTVPSGSSVTSGEAITSGSSVEVPSPGGITTGPAVTKPVVVEEDEKEPPVEVYDEFDTNGISYIVTEIKNGMVYVEVTGVINDSATTIYIPKKIEYNDIKMIVQSIGEDSFSYMKRLRKVVVAADISYIGKNAFRESKKFSRLIIKSNALSKVGKNVFKNVSNKLIIDVPKKKLTSYKKIFLNNGVNIKAIQAIKK